MTIDDVLLPTAAMIARNMFGPAAKVEPAWGIDIYHVELAGNWLGNIVLMDDGKWMHELQVEEAGMLDVVLLPIAPELQVRA